MLMTCALANEIQLLSVGSLRVSHLSTEPKVFESFVSNSTVMLENGQQLQVLQGSVQQINQLLRQDDDKDDIPVNTEFSILPQTLPRDVVEQLLQLLESYPYLDEDPDTVDGMPTYELFVDSPDLYSSPSNKIRDSDPNFVPQRQQLRQQLQKLLQPYLQTVITPFVQRHVSACRNKHDGDRACTPCHSLIRRYRHGDRVSHSTHHDGHAIATVVTSLSDYGTDYRGGLYVSTGYGQEREFLALHKGDTVVHPSTLLHGVQVHDLLDHPERTHRWSWIVWYRDSTHCHDYSYEWFAQCASRHNPLCQQLHSTKVGNIPGISQQDAAAQILLFNQQAAHGGAGMAAVKMARAYLGLLPSALPFDIAKAKYYYQLAMQSHHPDGHYGMAALLLQQVQQEQAQSSHKNAYNTDARVVQAVQYLEQAAQLHHAYAQYNLGMAHTYGYGTGVINGHVAAEWFVQSGLPEGYYIAAQQALAVGDQERHQRLTERAQALGFFAPWRTQAREATGSGGAGGVNLNLPWPIADDGREAFQLPSQLPSLPNIPSSNVMPDTTKSDNVKQTPAAAKESEVISDESAESESNTAAAAAAAADVASIKVLKEAAVTGHGGSTHPWEVLWVCTSVVTGCAVYNVVVALLQTRIYPNGNVTTIVKAVMESFLLWFPMVLAQSEFLYPLATLVMVLQVLVAATGMLLIRQPTSDRIAKQQTSNQAPPPSKHLDFLTLYRSSILYLTFIAILTVDFPSLFPRRFCKTEESGYGLMDVGAASFCISAGLVGARRHVAHASKAKKSVSSWKPFLHALPLVVIGIIRILVNKELDYQEHVSEYGVHWNFFFTLGILTLVPAILPVKSTMPSFLGPLCAMAVYQMLLSLFDGQYLIEDAPRTMQEFQAWSADNETNTLAPYILKMNLIVPPAIMEFLIANREGILGCIGYLCLYYSGEWAGYHWLWQQNNPGSISPTMGQLAVSLWVFHLSLVHGLHIPVSRRSTNLGFCSWALAHNVILLYGLQQLESLIIPMMQQQTNSIAKATIVPPIWEKANAHGLIMFLVANLLTGLVNLTVPTLETESWASLAVVCGYICCVGVAAIGIDFIFSFLRPSREDNRIDPKKKQ